MKPLILLFVSCLTLSAPTAAQNLKAYEKEGYRYLAQKNFAAAMEYFDVVLQVHTNYHKLRWQYAEAAMQLYAYEKAEQTLLKIEQAGKMVADNFPLLYYQLGEVKRLQGDYDAALVYFEKFLLQSPAEWKEKTKQRMESCRQSLRWLSERTEVEIQKLGKEINSPYSEFGAFARGDTLYFSSYRFDVKNSNAVPRPKTTKMMLSLGLRKAREVGAKFPASDSTHVANGAMTADGRFFFFNFCKQIPHTGDILCEIYLTVKDKRGRWSTPQRLPPPVNLPGYTSTQPTVAYITGKNQPQLIFASNRQGGVGGMDLYAVPLDSAWFCPCHADKFGTKKDPKLPAFAAPQLLQHINSEGDDITPFFHAASQTLYFSSDGWMGMGGFDIFQSKWTGSAFSAPENLKAGFNSSYNDLYPFFQHNGLSGYFSSNRQGVFYLDEKSKACCHDIFAFQLPQKTAPPPTDAAAPAPAPTLVPIPLPTAVTTGKNPLSATAETPQLRDFIGLPLYFDNDEPDKRTRSTTTSKTYEETVLPYLERQEEYRQRYAVGLKAEKRMQAEQAIEAHFEEEIQRGYDRLLQLTELIFNHLQNGERIEVVIKGFTSPRAQSEYNFNLARRRIASVRNHFQKWSDGALQPYLSSGKFIISEASMGETTARAGISDDLKDERNSIFSPDAARERRVEIIQIQQ